MLEVNATAPDFTLADHLGRQVSLSQFKGKQHVLLLFYPLDFTPTWTQEIPALEALADRLKAANTQPLGVSIDSVFCHANWAKSMGGVSFPLLADFHPKGAMADSFGLYLADNGITDRATVIIDAGGVIKHISAVGPPGSRDMGEIVAMCEKFNSDYSGTATGGSAGAGVEAGTLYVKSSCGASRAAVLALENMHLGDKVKVVNVSDDAGAMSEMKARAGNEQAPTLVTGDKTIQESADIIAHLVSNTLPV